MVITKMVAEMIRWEPLTLNSGGLVLAGGFSNQAPTADAQARTTAEDIALSTLLNATELQRGALNFSIAPQRTHGTPSDASLHLHCMVTVMLNGFDSLALMASGGQATSVLSLASIRVASSDVPDGIQRCDA